MKNGIYQIKNLETGDFYIGQSTNLKRRSIEHFSRLRNNNHANQYLQNAFNKYGKDNFLFEILIYCEQFELTRYEQGLVDVLNPEYNILTECVDSMYGYKFSDEYKQYFSDFRSGSGNPMYGKELSEETKQKMSISHADISGSNNPMYGKSHSAETKAIWSAQRSGSGNPMYGVDRSGKKAPSYGKRHSEETKRKISETLKKRFRT